MPASSPLLPPALCLMTGIWVGYRIEPTALPYYISAVLLLFLIRGITSRPSTTPVSLAPLQQTMLLWLLVMGIGVLRAVQITHQQEEALSRMALASDKEVFLLGHVRKVQRQGKLLLDARRLYAASQIVQLHGKVQVLLEEEAEVPDSGQQLVLRGYLHRPAGPRNPGAFDYRAYLAQQNITHVFYANSHQALPATTGHKQSNFIGQLQQKLTTYVHRYVHDDAVRSVLFALLLGDASSLTTTTRQAFQQTGLMHLLAVSGLHVMLVGMVVYECLQPVCLRMGFSWQTMMLIRICIVSVVLIIYLLITGAKPPVVRAVFMAILMMMGQQVQRQTASLNLLGFAALLLLLVNPANLFNAGFQLSFAAVLSILLLTPHFKRLLPGSYKRSLVSRYIVDGTLVSISASLGTLPVLLYHFSYVPFSGIVLNLVALPLTAAVLSAGICMLIAAPGFPPLAALLGYTVTWLAQCLLTVVNKGAQLAFSLSPGTPEYPLLLLIIALLLLLPGLLSSAYRWRYVAMVFIFVNAYIWSNIVSGENRQKLTLTFFDVHHGDACLVSFPNGKTLLVDTGGFIHDTPMVERVLLPYLHVAGIKTLDAVLLSHPHQDHAGGLPALSAAIPVSRVVTAPDAAYTRYLPQTRPLTHRTVLAGDTLHLDETTRLRVLAPDQKLNTHINPNTRSLVFQLQYGNTSMLFTGDATTATEVFVMDHFLPFLYGHVVKVPHHGSETSSSRKWVAALTREAFHVDVAVISVGTGHKYGLPDEEVVARWKEAGAMLHNTATDGALVLSSDGQRMEIIAY